MGSAAFRSFTLEIINYWKMKSGIIYFFEFSQSQLLYVYLAPRWDNTFLWNKRWWDL